LSNWRCGAICAFDAFLLLNSEWHNIISGMWLACSLFYSYPVAKRVVQCLTPPFKP
jgi:hypothetical protein